VYRGDALVIGAGAVGLAVARELAFAGRRTALWERHPEPGREQSTHNSGVVHSGVFVPPGTLRARLAVEGGRRLYEWAPQAGVPIERSGTLVVASHSGEVSGLEQYARWGRENGVPETVLLDAEGARSREPHLAPVAAALWVPNGGRVEATRLVRALDEEGMRLGVERRYSNGVVSATPSDGRWRLTGSDGTQAEVDHVVNATGVACAEVASLFGATTYRIYPCLGEYARVRGSKVEWVRSMVYGLPPSDYPGIGVHLTRTMGGELLIGPSATYQTGSTAPAAPVTPLDVFHREAVRLLPELRLDDLESAPAGVRAKTVPPGSTEAFRDYVIAEDPPGRGVIQLIGIESPGLTSCLAIGAYVRSLLTGSRPR
jgi:glycerol-3-phosphate dehydrogenase